FQDLAPGPVHLRRARRIGRATRPDLVGRPPPPPPCAFGPAGRHPFAPPGGFLACAHGLVPDTPWLHARPEICTRPAAVPRTALARPLRHRRAGTAGGGHVPAGDAA